jgi:hypothetical protein
MLKHNVLRNQPYKVVFHRKEIQLKSKTKGGVQYNEKILGYNAYNDNGSFSGSCYRLPEEGRGPEAYGSSCACSGPCSGSG